MAGNDRYFLDQKLAVLLGFEDGVSDVVEHLLTIESSEDLLDYLSQLLGLSNKDSIHEFVQDVLRYQRGESLTPPTPDVSAKVETKAPPARATATTATAKKTEKTSVAPTDGNSKTGVGATSNTAKQTKSDRKKKAPAAVATEVTTSRAGKSAASSASAAPVKKAPKKKPPKGRATHTCGCFGTIHKAFTNCLYCGRIVCSAEGNLCPFCGYLVEQPKKGRRPESVSQQAWELKEKLLKYDKDSAKRTKVVDDQADYYHSGDTWLNQTEQTTSAERESERQNALHRRQNMRLNVGL